MISLDDFEVVLEWTMFTFINLQQDTVISRAGVDRWSILNLTERIPIIVNETAP